MAKVSMDCPTPGCKEILLVKKNKIGKPFLFCKHCGCQITVRYAWAVEAWFGPDTLAEAPAKGEGSHAAPAGPAQASPPAEKKTDPAAPAGKTKRKDLWDLK
jgi:hypothetical protein